MDRIGVVGAGAWGTALAATARRAGRKVILWAREAEVCDAINQTHENALYLPGVALDPAIRATNDLAEICRNDAILLVTPAQHLRKACEALAPHWQAGVPAIICAKGIEQNTLQMMTEVVEQTLPGIAQLVLSGPTFAAEVARGLPTAITLACADKELGAKLAEAIGTNTFRPYVASDPVGSEIGGAVKNVLAIGCGIVEGKGLGDNARASLITRGLAEMSRLAVAKGGRAETLMGLSGLGDLILTASSTQSRNYSLGFAMGQGRALADILAERRAVTEGVYSASAVVDLARKLGVDMPICEAVNALLHDGAHLDQIIASLLARPLKSEH